MQTHRKLILFVAALTTVIAPSPAGAAPPAAPSAPTRLVTGLAGGSGGTVGPDGALYVTESAAGRVSRVDKRTGRVTSVVTGLPARVADYGGAVDVAFLGRTMYVLVTLVGADVGGTGVAGIYRIDGPNRFTIIADIGAYSVSHPPSTPFFLPSGVQYALQPYRGDLLVSDGHHNRVLRVTRSGDISELITFGNVVPIGLAVLRRMVFVAQAGPVPHLPENGRVLSLRPPSTTATQVAAGGRLLVDVEFGCRRGLYALAQGFFSPGSPEGSPAEPNTGHLLRADGAGGFTIVTTGLNRPTSMEIIGDTAYVVTLGGEIWTVDGISGRRHGRC